MHSDLSTSNSDSSSDSVPNSDSDCDSNFNSNSHSGSSLPSCQVGLYSLLCRERRCQQINVHSNSPVFLLVSFRVCTKAKYCTLRCDGGSPKAIWDGQ